MDSIGDNVMTIICVVVGILIIGCALVPIVDNASVVDIEQTTVEEKSGLNTTSSGVDYLEGYVEDLLIASNGTTLTVNGTEYSGGEFRALQIIGDSWMARFSGHNIIVRAAYAGTANDVVLGSGTFSFSPGAVTVTGSDDYTLTIPSERLVISNARALTDLPDTELYGRMTSPLASCIIGDGQSFISSSGTNIYTVDSTDLPANVTITKNENESYATVNFTSGAWYGPYEWEGTKTTIVHSTEESEFKDLYAIIPVLCILGMAYVLIRRFY